MLTKIEFARMIDHVLPKPFASNEDIKKGSMECIRFGFKTLSVHPVNVPLAAQYLQGTNIGIEATTGFFPWGVMTTAAKVSASRDSIKAGATEIDMDLNIGALKSKDYKTVVYDINEVVKAVEGSVVKVILENYYLTKEEISTAVKLCEEAGAHFIKTSTAFRPTEALLEDVILMRKAVSSKVGIKVVGSIAAFADLMKFYKMGVTRCGTSKSLQIMAEYEETQACVA